MILRITLVGLSPRFESALEADRASAVRAPAASVPIKPLALVEHQSSQTVEDTYDSVIQIRESESTSTDTTLIVVVDAGKILCNHISGKVLLHSRK